MKRHPLAAYFILTFLVSWGFWIPMVAISSGKWAVANPEAVVIHLWKWGGFSPFFVALAVAYGSQGLPGLQRLLQRFVRWKTGWIWYAVALLLPAALSLLVTLGHMMFGGDGPDFSQPRIYQVDLTGFYQDYNAWTILIPMFLQNLLLGSPVDSTPIGEETGWRGFALPHLQGRYNALASSVILALVWGLWRWPLYWTVDPAEQVMSYGLVLLGIVPGTILVTWIFNSSGGSLLLVLLYSNAIKMTDWFLPGPYNVSPVITVAVLWLAAAAVVVFTGPARLSRRDLKDACMEGGAAQRIPVVQNLPPR